MSRADTQLSKVRLEMSSEGIFAIAMTQIAIGLTTRRPTARR